VAQECYRRLRELESAVGDLSLAEHWQAGSIGIALEDTKVSGLMPFGPAFEKLEVGDVIEAVDGCEVTPGTVVSAISGENETVVQLQVRRKRDGERQTMDMVCSRPPSPFERLSVCVCVVFR
jgi:C-terminal processing protease CtpA/Prc